MAPPSPHPTASRKLAQELRAAIRSGTYRVGDKLPSQRRLAADHGIAQNTAREAFRILSEEGLVAADHGRGVFVRAPFMAPGDDLDVITDPELAPLEQGLIQRQEENPVYLVLGLVLAHCAALTHTSGITAWASTASRGVIEWGGGPTATQAAHSILPTRTPAGDKIARGVPGLRLIHANEPEAELGWLPSPHLRIVLRQLPPERG